MVTFRNIYRYTGSFLEIVFFLFLFITKNGEIIKIFVIINHLMNNHNLLGNFYFCGLKNDWKNDLKIVKFARTYIKRNKVWQGLLFEYDFP